MIREMLNAVPDVALLAIFVGGTVVIAVVGMGVVRRFLPGWRDASSVEAVLGVASMVMTLFALVLAFVVVNLFSSYEGASANVASEANSLSRLAQDARAFPGAEQHRIDHAVVNYIVEVRDKEFPALRVGRQDQGAENALNGLFDAVLEYTPVTSVERTFYNAAATELNALVAERRNRLDAATSSIPEPLVALMLLLAVISLVMVFFLKTHNPKLDVTLVAVVAVVLGVGLVTAFILEYPFSGSIGVSSAPFTSGSLGHLVATFR